MHDAPALEPDTIIADKFRVVRKLGEGGMGVVYEAENIALGQRLAVKVISRDAQDPENEEVIQRFHREARVMAMLESDNVVHVLDYGTLPDGSPYIAMEYLKGNDLGGYLVKYGPMSVPEAAEIGVAACNALAEAHAKGIVHRDLKPANLFLVERPGGKRVIKLLDFGISLFREAGVDPITGTSAGVGTPLYAAPELFASSRAADGRADIWSLGASLYELVTGSVPFPAHSLGELAQKLRSPPPRASALNRNVSEEFSDVLAACLQRDATKRTPTAAALGTALHNFRLLNQSSLLFGAGMDDNLRRAFAVTDVAPPVLASPLPHATPRVLLTATEVDLTRKQRNAATRPPAAPAQDRPWLWLVPAAIVVAAALGALAYFGLPRPPKLAAPVDATPFAAATAREAATVVNAPLAPLLTAPARSTSVPGSPTVTAPKRSVNPYPRLE